MIIENKKNLLRRILVLTFCFIGLFVLYDYYWFSTWTFSSYNFLKTNILNNVASIFGTKLPGWYILIGWDCKKLGIILRNNIKILETKDKKNINFRFKEDTV
jgi:hypothetical protein